MLEGLADYSNEKEVLLLMVLERKPTRTIPGPGFLVRDHPTSFKSEKSDIDYSSRH